MSIHEYPGTQVLDDLDPKVQRVEEENGKVASGYPLVPRFTPEEIKQRREAEKLRIQAATQRRREMTPDGRDAGTRCTY